jgi:hypothetical protein
MAERTILEEAVLAFHGQDNFHRSLGHFLSVFSDMEARMQETLRRFSGVTKPVAAAVFSGTRSQQAAEFIRRIAEASNWSETRQKKWLAISTKLQELTFLRNQIVHYGATWQDINAWLVTDALVAMPGKATKIPVSPTILADAIHDLEKLDCHIFAFAWPRQYAKHKADVDEVLKRAWRYKPPPQAGRQRKNRDKVPAHRRRQKASPKSRK